MKWLDKKVLGFRQDIRAFMTSKTNIAAVSTIIGACVACHMGQIDAVQAAQLIVPAALGLFIRDSVAGNG